MSTLHRLTFATGAAHRHNALIIAHGLMGNAFNWNTLCNRFAKHELLKDRCNAVYSLDMRNHGSSLHTPSHSCALMATDLEYFIAKDVMEHEARRALSIADVSGARGANVSDARPHRSVVCAHSMSGVVLMHSLVRQANAVRYRALSEELHGDEFSDEATWGTFWRQRVPSTMTSYDLDPAFDCSTLREVYDHSATAGATKKGVARADGRVAAGVVVDIAPIARAPDTFKTIHHDLGALMKLPLEQLTSIKDANTMLESLGVTNSQMRHFLLTNLKFDGPRAILKPNVAVLHRDLYDITFPDSPGTIETKCDLPMLFVFGESSPYWNEAAREAIPQYFSNAQIIVIPKAGHFVHHEKPNEFIDAVTPFISEHMSAK